MKLQKFLIKILFFSLIFFSCATTKNMTSESSVKGDDEILNQQEDLELSEEDDKNSQSEEPLLEEKITEEYLPPLEIPEENQTEEAKIEKIETESELSPIENIFSEEEPKEELEIIDIKEEIPENPEDYTNITEEPEENSNQIEEIKSDEKSLPQEENFTDDDEDDLQKPLEDENSEGLIQENSLEENQTEEIQEQTEIKPSRSVSMKNYQYLDIVYPGNGWIYLGESDNSKNFIFYGRKLGGKDTSFTLRSKNPGKFILHFYKNDALTGNFIDDYLEVIVNDEKSSSNEHILCPMYKEVVPPKYEKNQIKDESFQNEEFLKENKKETENIPQEKAQEQKEEKSIQGETVIQNTSLEDKNSEEKSLPENSLKLENSKNSTEKQTEETSSLPVELLLDKAKELYEQKNYEEAKKLLDKFLLSSVSRIDEALFLQGLILEAKSSVQNIKGAVDSYDLIVKRYPKSKFWAQANKRSIYLKRFYININ